MSKRLRSLILRLAWKSKRTSLQMSSLLNPKNWKRIMIQLVISNANMNNFKRSMTKNASLWNKLKKENLNWMVRESQRWRSNLKIPRKPLIWPNKIGPKKKPFLSSVSNLLNSSLMKKKRSSKKIELPMSHFLRASKHKIESLLLVVKNSNKGSTIWRINLLKREKWLRNSTMIREPA